MTITSALALWVALIALALLPGPGIAVLLARTLDSGLRAGLVLACGILCGDFFYIGLAIFGLSALVQFLGPFFVAIKYVGGAYLVFLGFKLLTASPQINNGENLKPSRSSRDFVLGMVTSMSNPKVVLFYLSFFPALLDLGNLSAIDVVSVLLITTASVGLVLLGYACIAAKTRSSFASNPTLNYLRYATGGLMIGGGTFVGLRA